MINPGGNPSVLFNKSAATRMNNTQVNAARMTMPFNQAAQQSLRNQYSKKNPGQPPVGNANSNQQVQLPNQPNQQVSMPTGGPQAPAQAAENFDPAVFAEEALNTLVGDIRFKQFLESPRVKDAMEAIRFKNQMNQDNPRYIPDTRPVFDQVIDRIGFERQ